MHIYVIRHGQSVANADKIAVGSRETPLSELGRSQAQLAAKNAKDLGIDLIISSPLKRATQTARIIAEGIGYPIDNIEVLPELTERTLGDLEGKSYATDIIVTGDYAQTDKTPGMEPIGLFHSRVQHVLRQIMQRRDHKNILIVCHNNVGRMLHVIASDKPALEMYNSPRLENAQISKLF